MADIALTAANIRPVGFAIVEQFEAGGAVVLGEAVVLAITGKVEKTTDASDGFVGIVVSTENKGTSAASGEMVGVCLFGLVTGFRGMTPGKLAYLAGDAGELADTGTVAVGYSKDATTLMVMPALADVPS